jgi:hypothetical protein
MTTNPVLGGHSFIQQLGTDPVPDATQAAEIVAACLDNGIIRFDTTYAPERVALGRALRELGRRDEATIIAWNFFAHFGPDDDIGSGGLAPYRPEHLPIMLEELATDRIDLLIVRPSVIPSSRRGRRNSLSSGSKREAGARSAPGGQTSPRRRRIATRPLFRSTTSPRRRPAGTFEAYAERGWETYATSPFGPGWELERLAAERKRPISALADLMLRYAAFAANVDFLMVSIRKVDWVVRNVDSWRRGPLSEQELTALTAA